MNESKKGLGLNQPVRYTIVVAGHLEAKRAAWFCDLDLSNEYDEDGAPVSVLRGEVRDQAMLHGLLARFRDLGLPLIAVARASRQEGAGPHDKR